MTPPPPTCRAGRPRVLFYTSFPSPVTGQNVAAETLYGFLQGVADRERIDTAGPGGRLHGGAVERLGRAVVTLRRLRASLRCSRPDVLYLVLSSSGFGRLRDLATIAIARSRVDRIVGHVQVGDFAASLDRPGLRRASRALLDRVDTVLSLSAGLAGPIRCATAAAVRVIPNTASSELSVSERDVEAKRARRAGAPTVRVAFVSNMLPDKGFEETAAGVALYNASRPARPATVDFVGAWPSPDRRAAFEARLDALGIAGASRVWGAVQDRDRIRELYLEADVALLPTRYVHEALPVTLVEALATGTPVVGTDWAALPDLVTPETGVPLADRTAGSVAEALRALADPETWLAKSRGARALYDASYHPDLVRAAFLDALGLEDASEAAPDPR